MHERAGATDVIHMHGALASALCLACGARAPWAAEVRLLDGRLISCRIAPLAGGATLAAFRVVVPGEAAMLRPADARTRRA